MNLYCIIGIFEKKSNLIGLYRSPRWYFLSGSIIKSGLKWSKASFKVARFYDKTWPWDIIYYQAGESSYSQKMKSDGKIGRLEIDFRFSFRDRFQILTSADSAVRILFGITVRCLSVKIKFKFEIRTLENLPDWKFQILTDRHAQ